MSGAPVSLPRGPSPVPNANVAPAKATSSASGFASYLASDAAKHDAASEDHDNERTRRDASAANLLPAALQNAVTSPFAPIAAVSPGGTEPQSDTESPPGLAADACALVDAATASVIGGAVASTSTKGASTGAAATGPGVDGADLGGPVPLNAAPEGALVSLGSKAEDRATPPNVLLASSSAKAATGTPLPSAAHPTSPTAPGAGTADSAASSYVAPGAAPPAGVASAPAGSPAPVAPPAPPVAPTSSVTPAPTVTASPSTSASAVSSASARTSVVRAASNASDSARSNGGGAANAGAAGHALKPRAVASSSADSGGDGTGTQTPSHNGASPDVASLPVAAPPANNAQSPVKPLAAVIDPSPAGIEGQLAGARLRDAFASVANHAVLRGAASGEIDIPELGRVAVHARTVSGAVDVDIAAERPETRAALHMHASAMTADLREADVRVSRLTIDASHATPRSQDAPGSDGSSGASARGQNESSARDSARDGDDSGSDDQEENAPPIGRVRIVL